MRGKVVAFADLGAVVSVVERCNGVQRRFLFSSNIYGIGVDLNWFFFIDC